MPFQVGGWLDYAGKLRNIKNFQIYICTYIEGIVTDGPYYRVWDCNVMCAVKYYLEYITIYVHT